MNPVFFTAFYLLQLWFLATDITIIRKQKASLKWAYYGIHLAAFLLVLFRIFGFDVPMPTRYFVNQVAPWVRSMIP